MFERYDSLQTHKAHPQENMNQIFDKTEYQKKEKIMDFYYSFSNKRVCKLFTRQ
jgi:hypothetical protein